MNYPILEYDQDKISAIEPQNLIAPINIPEHAILCFFEDVINLLKKKRLLSQVHSCKTEMGIHPVYLLKYEKKNIALMHPGVGAPLAAGLFEQLIALGCRKFIACGRAGILDPTISEETILLPNSAIRDEGTSYHYAEPSREIQPTEKAFNTILQEVIDKKLLHLVTKTWTTDAFFRETSTKIEKRKSEGALAVEMEMSALCAVARFRKVEFAQILYAGDEVRPTSWKMRLTKQAQSTREKLVCLAAEACFKI